MDAAIREIARGDGWVCFERGKASWLRIDVPAARLETLLGSLQARFGRRHPHWVVDLTKSDYVDSRALGALLQILDQSSDAGALVALAVSSDRAALAFQVLGFKDRFHWFKSADEAQAFVTAEIARRAEADKGGSG